MIEIIKKGTIKYKWTCVHCGCEFTAEPGDESKNNVYDNQGIIWNKEINITCPTCNKKLSDTMIPSSIRKML